MLASTLTVLTAPNSFQDNLEYLSALRHYVGILLYCMVQDLH